MEEHHHVGVLFDRAGFAQIVQFRQRIAFPVLILFRFAVHLRQHQHRHLQVLRQFFQTAGDRRDFHLPVFDADRFARFHQLKIIDHDQIQLLPVVDLARLRPDFEDRNARGFVNQKRGLAHLRYRRGQILDLLPPDFAVHDIGKRDFRLGAEQTLRHAHAAHFQTEKQHIETFAVQVPHDDVADDVQRDGGLADRRPGGQHEHFPLLQPAADQAVQIGKSGRDPRLHLFVIQSHEAGKSRVQQLRKRFDVRLDKLVADLEDLGFDAVEQRFDIAVRILAHVDRAAAHPEHFAEHGEIAQCDTPRFDVRRAGDR